MRLPWLMFTTTLLAAAGCDSTPSEPSPPPAPPSSPAAAKTPAKTEPQVETETPATTEKPAPAPESAEITLRLDDPAPKVHPGDRLRVELRNSSMGIDPRYGHSWGEASVQGTAVAFDKRTETPPPPDMDGGSVRLTYEFSAVAPGSATITIPAENTGEEANATDWTMKVEVTPP